MTLSGTEIKKLFASDWEKLLGWSGDVCFDGEIYDGETPVESVDCESAKGYEMRGLIYCTDGNSTTNSCSVALLVKKWRKAETHISFVVSVANIDVERFRTLMTENNWAVLK